MEELPQSPWTWFHVVLTTYGAWLPGDPRGFRTRHHRKHVEGDYVNPPPIGKHAIRLERSRKLIKQTPVRLSPAWRSQVGASLIERLLVLGAPILIVAVSTQHVHVLAKLPAGDARHGIGLAKKHVTFSLHKQSWRGRLWGMRGKLVRIRDRKQQLNTFRYILKHEQEGAWVKHFVAGTGKS